MTFEFYVLNVKLSYHSTTLKTTILLPQFLLHSTLSVMRVDIDKIEIKEPPIEELSKKRSCLGRFVVTGCGCFVLAFIASLVILRFTVGPQTKELKDIPSEFKAAVTIYDFDGVEKITYTPGRERGRIIETAGYVPKLIIAPFIIYFDKEYKYIPLPEEHRATAGFWEKFFTFVKEPITDHRDVYLLEWQKLSAEADFIEEYYRKGLEKLGFLLNTDTKDKTHTQFFFSKGEQTTKIEGTIRIVDENIANGTDYVSLTVVIPTE